MTHAGTKSSTVTNEDLDTLRAAISAGPVRPFLVTLARTQLNVHVAREATKAFSRAINSGYLLKRDISRRISALGFHVSIRVKLHSRNAFDKPRSLQQFIAKFGPGDRHYDPTGVFDEAHRLVEFACEVRRQLGGDVKGIYWSSRWRTTYVLLNEDAFADGCYLRREKLIAVEQAVVKAHEAGAGPRSTDNAQFEVLPSRNVRLCFDVPGVPLVPIDEASLTLERARRQSVANRPRLLGLATFARAPILGALLGMSSAGVAMAKLSPIENQPMLTGEDRVAPTVTARNIINHVDYRDDAAGVLSHETAVFPGGPGLHMLWRDPVGGAVGQGAQLLEPISNALASSEERVSRDDFFEVSKSGAIFGTPAPITRKRRLDLAWLAESERADSGGSDAGRRKLIALPGIAAVPGLSTLTQSDSSDQTYGIVLSDLQLYFGLPQSLQAEARWHFENATQSSTVSHRSGESFPDTAPMTRSESYWEWLRRISARGPSNDGNGSGYRRYFDNPLEAQRPRRPRGSST